MGDRGPRVGEQHDLVALPLDPGVLHVDLGAAEAADLAVRLVERREAVVDDHLPHLHGVRALVAHVQLDFARLQNGALDGQLLLRHADPVEPRRVQQNEQPDRHREHRERRHTASHAGRRVLCAVAGLHHSSTWKKPIQPSSANSLTCAWNMNLPAYGKRSSRMPRSPWPWTTVSVKSRGSRRVPVG